MCRTLKPIADDYINFLVVGKRIQIPYCIVKTPKEIPQPFDMARTDEYTNFAAKGTPEQIRKVLNACTRKNNFSLQKHSAQEITDFMVEKGIGIDCSGFVYHVLDRYIKKYRHNSLEKIIVRSPGLVGKIERWLLRKNRVRRISGTTLTSDLNTIKINKVKDAKPGDLIRLTHTHWEGKHPAIIIEVIGKYLIYAHSSEYTQYQGPHYARIEIIDPGKGLESQNWLEITQNRENYGKYAFNPKRGDSIRRLKYLL